MSKLRPIVFFAPFLLLIAAVATSYKSPEAFLTIVTAINDWILVNFSWLFSAASLFFVGTLVWAFFSPLGNVRIGGPDAKPLMTKWNWFAITLTTTVAIGILFWATAEPMYHYYAPPASSGIAAQTPNAAKFALSTLFLHWSFTPYAIYTVPALAFALAFYNLKTSYSLGGMLSTVFGKYTLGVGGQLIDGIALFALVAGMGASLGTGILTIAGGVNQTFGTGNGPFILAVITAAIVGSFVLSAATGVTNGIRFLADWNTKFFFIICAFAFVFGPTVYILSVGIDALGNFLGTFFERSLYTGVIANDPWPGWWTNFYWANWLAWAPVTSLFLGRISVGYTVREFISTTMLWPSVFAIVWMSIFGGMSLFLDINNAGVMKASLDANGAESVVYKLFEYLPFAQVLIIVFAGLSFLSFVTGADANTEAIAALCEDRKADDTEGTGLALKVIWGTMIGFIAWFMVSTSGIGGIKMLSNLGGFPALFIVLGSAAVLWKYGLRVNAAKQGGVTAARRDEPVRGNASTAP